jgi:sugar phosphate isomerase/epimerase
MAKPVMALQLYTVRDLLAKDFDGTVRKVKQIGYDAVEMAGGSPHDAPRLKAFLDEVGIRPIGAHVPIEKLETALDDSIAFAKALAMPNLICPYLPDNRRAAREDWVKTAKSLDKAGAACRKAGLRLSYHNHSFEFVKFDGKYALDMLFENCSPQNVLSELDTFWVQHGGEDPVKYIEKYAGRICILHVKDMAGDAARSFTEVGAGILNWPAIHKAALKAGVEYYCVEQDVCPGSSMDSAAKSAKFVSKLLASK